VLTHTRRSNINAEANDVGEYNLKGKGFMYVRGTRNVPSLETPHSLSIVIRSADGISVVNINYENFSTRQTIIAIVVFEKVLSCA
jgi:hypothetical protein